MIQPRHQVVFCHCYPIILCIFFVYFVSILRVKMAYLTRKIYTMYTQCIHKIHLEPNLNIVGWSARNCNDLSSEELTLNIKKGIYCVPVLFTEC